MLVVPAGRNCSKVICPTAFDDLFWFEERVACERGKDLAGGERRLQSRNGRF
jgi:hypothetical protein